MSKKNIHEAIGLLKTAERLVKTVQTEVTNRTAVNPRPSADRVQPPPGSPLGGMSQGVVPTRVPANQATENRGDSTPSGVRGPDSGRAQTDRSDALAVASNHPRVWAPRYPATDERFSPNIAPQSPLGKHVGQVLGLPYGVGTDADGRPVIGDVLDGLRAANREREGIALLQSSPRPPSGMLRTDEAVEKIAKRLAKGTDGAAQALRADPELAAQVAGNELSRTALANLYGHVVPAQPQEQVRKSKVKKAKLVGTQDPDWSKTLRKAVQKGVKKARRNAGLYRGRP